MMTWKTGLLLNLGQMVQPSVVEIEAGLAAAWAQHQAEAKRAEAAAAYDTAAAIEATPESAAAYAVLAQQLRDAETVDALDIILADLGGKRDAGLLSRRQGRELVTRWEAKATALGLELASDEEMELEASAQTETKTETEEECHARIDEAAYQAEYERAREEGEDEEPALRRAARAWHMSQESRLGPGLSVLEERQIRRRNGGFWR